MSIQKASNEDTEKRIAALEDRNAVLDVVASYCYYVDEGKTSEIMELFHDKAQINMGPIGRFKNKEEIRKFFSEILPNMGDETHHFTHNHLVKVNGEQASHKSYLDMILVSKGESAIGVGRYEDTLVKEKGKWVFMSRNIDVPYMFPLIKGEPIFPGT